MSLLSVSDLSVSFESGRRWFGRSRGVIDAVKEVGFELGEGETLALVGESGSGKSTLARAALSLERVDSGRVVYTRRDGEQLQLLALPPARLRSLRPELQIVFQNPGASLNPRFRVSELLSEAPRLHFGWTADELDQRVRAVLARVGLSPDHARRFPHEFSAGQRQRLAIARALMLEPRVLVCDEVTSSLDVSVQAGILNLLYDLQEERGLAYLFIAHDLAVVRVLAHRIAVMRAGRVVETGSAEQMLEQPEHEYTRELLASSR